LSEFVADYKSVNWEKANCQDIGTNAFYILDDEPRHKQAVKTEYARAVCAICPIQKECLEYAFKHEQYGIWGATTAQERAYIKTGKLGGPTVRDGLAELNSFGISLREVHAAARKAKDEH
jgi:WhiB family redox-sensing transcriptional regulator